LLFLFGFLFCFLFSELLLHEKHVLLLLLHFFYFFIKLLLDFLEDSQSLRSPFALGFNDLLEHDLQLVSESGKVVGDLCLWVESQ
jgi:hypothetical protein